MSIDKFIAKVSSEIVSSVHNNYKDNFDFYRYPKMEMGKDGKPARRKIVKFLNKKGFYNQFDNKVFSNEIKKIDFPFSDFFYLYDLLEDNNSKELLIKIIVYRILGHKKIKLPLSKPSFWIDQKKIEEHQSKDDFIQIDFMNLKLPLTNLNFLGVPITIYYFALGINLDFIIKQYELHNSDIDIQADHGDIVLDCGGCFGDTALYFANLVGMEGRVKVFEFIPNNIEIFTKNVQLNPTLAAVIDLVDHPLWNESNQNVFFSDNGPGSRVSLDFFEGYTGRTTTLSIDDYVNSSGLEKVDFIKMDIEGAETNALQGAIGTIKRFRPKLAIALYHSTKDFDNIPRLIDTLELGYKFYLSHSTIYGEETMLFGTVKG